MKSIKQLLSILLLTSSSMLARENIKVNKLVAKKICVDELSVKKGCKACRTITSKDFLDPETNTLSKTLVITEPNKYCLGESITFEPAFVGQSAIEIQSNDVILDLCENILRQTRDLENPENDTADAIGIRIGEEFSFTNVYKNITVKTGTIIGFTGQGVGAVNVAIASGPFAFESITISDLNVYECGSSPSLFYASGIDLDSFASDQLFNSEIPAAYKNVTIERCKVERCLGNGSINLYTGENLVITDTQANELTDEDSVFYVFGYALSCRNLQMFNCQGNNTSSFDKTTMNQVGPAIIQGCVNVYIKECQFNNSFAESTSILNTNLSNTVDAIFENCQFNNSIGGQGSLLVSGLHMSDSVFQINQGNGMKFINCQFNRVKRVSDIDNLNSFAVGFIAITLRNITFERCEAVDISSEGEGLIDCYGYIVATLIGDVTPQVGNVRNVNFSSCIARDVVSNRNTSGFFVGGGADFGIVPALGRGQTTNMSFDSCIAERIRSTSAMTKASGIYEGNFIFEGVSEPNPALINLFVRNCCVSDVRSNVGGIPSTNSAGILIESVINPVICDNILSDCDRGIQLTGTNQIIPNGFQLAETKNDALAKVPVFVDLNVELLVKVPGLEPIPAAYTIPSPHLTGPVEAQTETTDPLNGCSEVQNNLTNSIGIVQFGVGGFCGSATYVINAEEAGAIATLIISDNENPTDFGGSPAQQKVAVIIARSDGDALLQFLADNPGTLVTIDTKPSASPQQIFTNQRTEDDISIFTSQVDSLGNFIVPTEDLTELGWQIGDAIIYNPNGGDNISNLDPDNNPYYAIVYSPGFSEDGLIQNNKVTSCSIAGYQDDRQPTSSGWFNNTAFKNSENYIINWGIEQDPKVDEATFPNYPASTNKYFNLSIKK